MTFVFEFRRDFDWRWTNENPVLADGEPGFEKNTGRFKIGNGETPWQELPYFTPGGGGGGDVDAASLLEHIYDTTPHPVYDDGPSLSLLYQNAKV